MHYTTEPSGAVTTAALQTRTLRLQDVNQPARGHVCSKWDNSDFPDFKAINFSIATFQRWVTHLALITVAPGNHCSRPAIKCFLIASACIKKTCSTGLWVKKPGDFLTLSLFLKRGVMILLTIIVDLPISLGSSNHFCFMCVAVLFLGA